MGQTAGGALRRSPDRIVAGVCAGLAGYTRVDPLLIRLVFVVLAAAHGIGILLYIVLWLLMEPAEGAPLRGQGLGDRVRALGEDIRNDVRSGFRRSTSPPPAPSDPAGGRYGSGSSSPPPVEHGPRGLWLGLVLIALGAFFLLENLGILNGFRWDLFWPAVLIAIGLLFLLRRR